MSYLYLCLLVVQYLKIVNSYDRIEILMVSTALNILLVMRISIVILYLIVFYDYTVYKKRPPQSDTSVHVCVFVLYIAVTVTSHFHIVSLCLSPYFMATPLKLHFGSQTQWCRWRTNGLPLSKHLTLRETSHRKTRIPAMPSDGQSCAA